MDWHFIYSFAVLNDHYLPLKHIRSSHVQGPLQEEQAEEAKEITKAQRQAKN